MPRFVVLFPTAQYSNVIVQFVYFHVFANEQPGNVDEILSLLVLTNEMKSASIVAVLGSHICPMVDQQIDALEKACILPMR